jgi:hypothetical protein
MGGLTNGTDMDGPGIGVTMEGAGMGSEADGVS